MKCAGAAGVVEAGIVEEGVELAGGVRV